MKQRIRNTVYIENDCRLEGISEHQFATDVTPRFVLDHIIHYYIEKFSRPDDQLAVRKLNSHYQLYRASDMKEIGRGDQQSMECLKKKLDVQERDIIKVLNELSDEGNRLN